MLTSEFHPQVQKVFRFSPSIYMNSLDYPDQFIKIQMGVSEAGLNQKDKVEIDNDLAKKIIDICRLRNLEGDKPLDNITSLIIKNLITLSNCHRSMLYLFGFSLQELKDRDMCSEIINEYFLKSKDLYRVEQVNISKKISEILSAGDNVFPMSLNFYSEESDAGYTATHSVTILGILPSGKPLCFHKNGIGENTKTELTTLDKIVESRTKGYKFTLHTKQEVDLILAKFREDEKQKHAK